MMHRPGYKLLKKKAIRFVKTEEDDDAEEERQCNGNEDHFDQHAKKLRYSARERLTLQRKVGEGIFFFRRRTASYREKKARFYDQRIQRCMNILTDKCEFSSFFRLLMNIRLLNVDIFRLKI